MCFLPWRALFLCSRIMFYTFWAAQWGMPPPCRHIQQVQRCRSLLGDAGGFLSWTLARQRPHASSVSSTASFLSRGISVDWKVQFVLDVIEASEIVMLDVVCWERSKSAGNCECSSFRICQWAKLELCSLEIWFCAMLKVYYREHRVLIQCMHCVAEIIIGVKFNFIYNTYIWYSKHKLLQIYSAIMTIFNRGRKNLWIIKLETLKNHMFSNVSG
jgi:hypothetical protein